MVATCFWMDLVNVDQSGCGGETPPSDGIINAQGIAWTETRIQSSGFVDNEGVPSLLMSNADAVVITGYSSEYPDNSDTGSALTPEYLATMVDIPSFAGDPLYVSGVHGEWWYWHNGNEGYPDWRYHVVRFTIDGAGPYYAFLQSDS